MIDDKQKKAREIIKHHLKVSGKKPVILSKKMITRWWNVINAAVFYDEILPVIVKIKQVPEQFACVHVWYDNKKRKTVLTINPKFVSRKLFLTVLSHEMVHVWDVQHKKKMGHRAQFFRWEPRFRWILNLPLSVNIEEKDFDYRKYKKRRKSKESNNRTTRNSSGLVGNNEYFSTTDTIRFNQPTIVCSEVNGKFDPYNCDDGKSLGTRLSNS